VDVSGEPYQNLELEAIAVLSREEYRSTKALPVEQVQVTCR
jgi:hypothetical protein